MIEQARPRAGRRDVAAARHEQAVRALRTGLPRYAERLLRVAHAVVPVGVAA